MNAKLFLKIEDRLENKAGISMLSAVNALNDKSGVGGISGVMPINAVYKTLKSEANKIDYTEPHFADSKRDAEKMLKTVEPILKHVSSIDDVCLVHVLDLQLGMDGGIKNIRVTLLTQKSFIDIMRKYLFVSAGQIEDNIQSVIKQQKHTTQGFKNALRLSNNYLAIKRAVPNDALFLNSAHIDKHNFNYKNRSDIMSIKQASNLDEYTLDVVSDIVFNTLSKPKTHNQALKNQLKQNLKLMHKSHHDLVQHK